MIIGIGLLFAIIMGILGRYVAKEKNRSKSEGFWLGFLFSILGVIIVALLPTKEKKEVVKESESPELSNEEKIKEAPVGLVIFVIILCMTILVSMISALFSL